MCLCKRGHADDAFLCHSLPVLVGDEEALFEKVTTKSNWLFTNLNESRLVFTPRLCLCVSVCWRSFSLNHGSNEIIDENMFHGP